MSALSSGKDPFKDTLHELLHVVLVLLLKIKVLHVHVSYSDGPGNAYTRENIGQAYNGCVSLASHDNF